VIKLCVKKTIQALGSFNGQIMKDFYYILGVGADSTLSEIKDAYRKLSVKFHPDLNPGDEYFEGRFREINEAYQTLSDPQNRMDIRCGIKKGAGRIDHACHKRSGSRKASRPSPV